MPFIADSLRALWGKCVSPSLKEGKQVDEGRKVQSWRWSWLCMAGWNYFIYYSTLPSFRRKYNLLLTLRMSQPDSGCCPPAHSINPEELIQSIISKMKYTCNNPHCRFRGKRPNHLRPPAGNYKTSPQGVGMSNSCVYPALKDPLMEASERRGLRINNWLHSGSHMKEVLYESESPDAQVRRSRSSKDYDSLYRSVQNRIRRSWAPHPRGQSKIQNLIRKDKLRAG